MKRIFIFPTVEEAKAFLLTEPRDPVFVGGVGMAEIAAATVRAVKARKPQLAVLAGIAGACERTLRRGEVVEVVTERVAGIPARYAREYETTGPDLGLPLAAGVTVNRSGDALREEQQAAAREPGTTGQAGAAGREQTGAVTGRRTAECPANGAGPAAASLTAAPLTAASTPEAEEPLPRVENMEGAAFFAVCEALGVACCEIRAVSNYVGEPFAEWAVGEAVENLTEKLTQIFGNNE